MEPSGYRPIACDFHDQLESYATLKRRVHLTLKHEGGVGTSAGGAPAAEGGPSAEGLIADIYTTADKQEFLRLDNGAEIRLDRIVDVAPAA